MRRWVLLLPLLALLSGCAKAPASPPSPLAGHAGTFDTTAHISCRELRATAAISQQTPDACTVTFLSPDSLQGMEFVFRQDEVDMSYRGLSFRFNPRSMPANAVAGMAVNAIGKAMRDEDIVPARTDDGLELTGTLEAGAFTLRLDEAEGSLLKLSIPDEELEIEFRNFRFLD